VPLLEHVVDGKRQRLVIGRQNLGYPGRFLFEHRSPRGWTQQGYRTTACLGYTTLQQGERLEAPTRAGEGQAVKAPRKKKGYKRWTSGLAS
jgi:hypothetical protein